MFKCAYMLSLTVLQMIVLGSILQTSAYVMQAPAGPFGTFVAAYLLDGVGMALQVSSSSIALSSVCR
jgi:hypothetical protein